MATPNTRIVSANGGVKSHNEVTKEKPLPIQKAAWELKLDFSKCSFEDLLDYAKDTVVIKKQAACRAAFWAKDNFGKDGKTPIKSFQKITSENMSGTVDVKALLAARRAPGKSIVDKAELQFKKMTAEEQRAMIARFQAGIKAKQLVNAK
jgi:hypothetical protein